MMRVVLPIVLSVGVAAGPSGSRAEPSEPSPDPRVEQLPPSNELRARTGRRQMGGGIALVSIAIVAPLAVGLPLWRMRNNSLERAEYEEFRVDRRRALRKARRRHIGAMTAFGLGGAALVGGIALLAVGAVTRERATRPLVVAPQLGPGFAGASASMRF